MLVESVENDKRRITVTLPAILEYICKSKKSSVNAQMKCLEQSTSKHPQNAYPKGAESHRWKKTGEGF
jgi:hypothetical protein